MTEVDVSNKTLELRNGGSLTNEVEIECRPSSSNVEKVSECLGKSIKRQTQFEEGLDVLAHWSDGLFYLGVVVQVNELRQKCLVKFEDSSHYWCSVQHLKKASFINKYEKPLSFSSCEPSRLCVGLHSAAMPGADIVCTLCEEGRSEPPNEIVLCDNCNHGYHQKCHKPKIPNKVLRPDVPWLCRKCVFATTTRPGGAARKGVGAQALLAVKKVLPYQLKSLMWDTFHQRNKQDCYCYCGGPGEWYVKMLQCRRCLQWFHEACLQCLDYPLLMGDHFYVFVCAVCNYGKEFLHRLELPWADVAHLVLFGLTLQQRKRFFDLDSEIIPFINACWVQLQLPESMKFIPENGRRNILLKVLNKNSSRFKSGSEVKKKMHWYSLRVSHPPSAPFIGIPKVGNVTEEVLSKAKALNSSLTHSVSENNEIPPKIQKFSKEPRNSKNQIESCCSSSRDTTSSGSSSASTSSNTRIYNIKRNRDKVDKEVESDSEDTSSIGTLDSFIPKPTNFEGKNNPFRVQDRKRGRCKIESRAKRARPSAEPLPAISGTKTSSESEAESLIEKRIVSPVTATKIPVRDLKSSVSSYFGAENRFARGEKCKILARRCGPQGQMQYLVEWEGVS